MGKKGYIVELKIKERIDQHYTVIDHIKKTTPEAAATILIKKYFVRKKKKDVVDYLDDMYNELIDTIELALKKR